MQARGQGRQIWYPSPGAMGPDIIKKILAKILVKILVKPQFEKETCTNYRSHDFLYSVNLVRIFARIFFQLNQVPGLWNGASAVVYREGKKSGPWLHKPRPWLPLAALREFTQPEAYSFATHWSRYLQHYNNIAQTSAESAKSAETPCEWARQRWHSVGKKPGKEREGE